jgi:hypothetical protein
VNKRFLMACLAALAFSVQAAPITFYDVSFDVTAIAQGDGAPGFDAQSSPPTPAPLSASASSGTLDLATAGAIAGPGLLTTSADASGGGGIASSVASAHFAGSLLNDGPISLNIDYMAMDLADGSGDAGTSLFVLLVSDGITLFQDFITGPWQFSYNPVRGTTGVLDLTLSSEASAGFVTQGLGNASAFGLVSLTGTVPESPTLSLTMLALAAMWAVGQRRALGGRTTRP